MVDGSLGAEGLVCLGFLARFEGQGHLGPITRPIDRSKSICIAALIKFIGFRKIIIEIDACGLWFKGRAWPSASSPEAGPGACALGGPARVMPKAYG